MDSLPPAGWSDLARRSDLGTVSLDLEATVSRLCPDIGAMIDRQTRWYLASQLVLGAAIVGSILTIPH
jgi:hypothetical protein